MPLGLQIGSLEELDVDPWERQKGETSVAFQAWYTYRDMEDPRSYRKVAQQLHKSLSLIGRWSRAWRWQERLYAWQTHIDRLKQRELEKTLIEVNTRHGSLARLCQSKIYEALNTVNEKNPLPLSLMAQLLANSVAIERMSYGMALPGAGATRRIETTTLSLTEKREPDNIITENIRKLSAVDRSLLRELSLKYLRRIQEDSGIDLNADIDEIQNTITVEPQIGPGDERPGE